VFFEVPGGLAPRLVAPQWLHVQEPNAVGAQALHRIHERPLHTPLMVAVLPGQVAHDGDHQVHRREPNLAVPRQIGLDVHPRQCPARGVILPEITEQARPLFHAHLKLDGQASQDGIVE
jgi:hypothetical protein